MTEDAQLKLRISHDLRDYIETEAKKNHRTINSEVIYRLEKMREQQDILQKVSGRSLYFMDMNCVEEFPKESLHEQIARIEQRISQLFYENPDYQLINIETLNEGRKIRYWYTIPRSESFRD